MLTDETHFAARLEARREAATRSQRRRDHGDDARSKPNVRRRQSKHLRPELATRRNAFQLDNAEQGDLLDELGAPSSGMLANRFNNTCRLDSIDSSKPSTSYVSVWLDRARVRHAGRRWFIRLRDPDEHLGYAYVTNKLDFYLVDAQKALRDAPYRAIRTTAAPARVGSREGSNLEPFAWKRSS